MPSCKVSSPLAGKPLSSVQSFNGVPRPVHSWPQYKLLCGVYKPLSSAAAIVMTLKIEPGTYSPWVARLKKGRSRSPVK